MSPRADSLRTSPQREIGRSLPGRGGRHLALGAAFGVFAAAAWWLAAPTFWGSEWTTTWIGLAGLVAVGAVLGIFTRHRSFGVGISLGASATYLVVLAWALTVLSALGGA